MQGITAILLLLVAIVVNLQLPLYSAYAQSTSSTTPIQTVVQLPLDFNEFTGCGQNGAGEFVHVTGTLLDVVQTMIDNSGFIHFVNHLNWQGVSGTGLSSGIHYHATGALLDFTINDRIDLTQGAEATAVNYFNLISQGNSPNYLVRDLFHETLNANQAITAFIDNIQIVCS